MPRLGSHTNSKLNDVDPVRQHVVVRRPRPSAMLKPRLLPLQNPVSCDVVLMLCKPQGHVGLLSKPCRFECRRGMNTPARLDRRFGPSQRLKTLVPTSHLVVGLRNLIRSEREPAVPAEHAVRFEERLEQDLSL